MKIRSGFVSNSSSSSFIVAVKTIGANSALSKIEELTKPNNVYDNSMSVIDNMNDLIKELAYFEPRIPNKDDFKTTILFTNAFKNKDHTFLKVEVSNHDTELINILTENEDVTVMGWSE